ncbi:MAG: hypothetical protein AB7F89_14195 [Pirellulaceae bacterium]
MERIRADIADLRKAIVAPSVDKDLAKRLEDRLRMLERGAEDVRGTLGKIGADVQDAQGKGLLGLEAAGKLQERIAGLKDLVKVAGEKVGPLAGIGEKVASMEARASWLPWIAGAAGTGGAGLAGWAVLALARRKLKQAMDARPGSQTSVSFQPAPNPIKETIIRSESKYVPVEKPSAELASLHWAMDELAKRYPGQNVTVETLKSFAAQHLSGSKT